MAAVIDAAPRARPRAPSAVRTRRVPPCPRSASPPSPAPSSARALPAASAGPTRSPPSCTATAPTPRHLALPGHELDARAQGRRANALLTLQLDGASELALPKAIQRDPIKGDLEHVDLVLVRRGEKVTVEVPVTLTGEADPGRPGRPAAGHAVRRGRGHAHPDRFEVSIEGMRGRRPHPRRRRHAARAAPRWSPTRTRSWSRSWPRRPPSSSRPSWPAPRRRPGSSATSRPRRRGGRRGDRRRRRTPTPTASSADGPCSWSSGSATPARRTRATGTTSASWSLDLLADRVGRALQGAPGARRGGRGPARPAAGAARCWPSRGRT